MRHIRYPQWMVLTCMTAIAACTSTGGDEGSVGNTEFNVVIPDAEGTDVQSVEYTINCLGNGTEFLNNLASFPDEVTINGNLEVVEPGQGPNFPADAEIRQGYMDLPPGPCTAELRARDNDDEVICTAQEPFNVEADTNTVVELVLICGLSFQADVGTADIIGTFQYNVANFCPDLFVLNCLESFPQVPVDENNQPTGPAVSTCEVRYRDGDSTCGTSCDPQTCEADGLAGIICTQPGGDPLPGGFDPGPDPGVQTTVTCGGADMACNGGAFGQTSCAWSGDQLGTVAINAAIVGNPATFDVSCEGAASGATITCEATTTDGDEDCIKTKVVSFDCPGLNFCDVSEPGDNLTDCDDGNECTNDSCDRNAQACAYTNVPAEGGNNCTTGTGGPGECDGNGVCGPFGCADDTDCDDPTTECLVAPVGACDPINGDPNTGFCADEVPGNAGGACDSTTGGAGDTGTCQAGTCVDNCVGADCTDGNVCTSDVCTSGGGGFTCSNPPANCTACCDAGGGTDTADCTNGVCADPPQLADVCQQFATGPVTRTASCDPALGDECICEKPQFIAADCELVGNSAPIPLQASVQQLGVAFAGQPVATLPQDAVVLPAALVCGFIGAGFQSAEVGDSTVEITYTNADLTSSLLSSFVNPSQPAPGALVSPHGDVLFDFGLACGDNCAAFCDGSFCADGTTACTVTPIDTDACLGQEVCASTGNDCRPSFITEDCGADQGGTAGTGPGVVAPFFAGAPGSIPGTHPDPGGLVTVTPDSTATVDIETGYDGIRLILPDVGGLVAGCLGGACAGAGGGEPSVCTAALRGTVTSPRVMFDSNCTKLGFAACGGTGCDTTADCPFNSTAIGGALPGQTCDTSAGGPPGSAGLCTDVNSGTCGLGGAGLCPDTQTACGFCEDVQGNTGTCSASGFACALDIDCPFGVADLCSAPTPCVDDNGCATGETCELSDDYCNPVITAISGGQIPTCCSPFGDFTATANICKESGLDDDQIPEAPDCCNQNLPNGNFKDDACVTQPNIDACCAAIGVNYPNAGPDQSPQLYVNPAP